MQIYLALVHYPVLSRHAEIVTTSITNLDIHDLARIARTYDLSGTFLVSPISEQREIVDTIVGHWTRGDGPTANPARGEAFQRVQSSPSLEAVIDHIATETGQRPRVIGTSAQISPDTITYPELRAQTEQPGRPQLLVFGTGWGLAPAAMALCEKKLPPIQAKAGRNGYNHLPVRAAVAIILDRILGDFDPKESLS